MTNENKKNILDYITNKIVPTAKNDSEIFLEQGGTSGSDWTNYLPSGWSTLRFEGIVAGNEMTSNMSIIYGGYVKNNETYGLIILVDTNFKPFKTIYEYDSGTELRYIQYMKQAEDGTFYFIDDTTFTYSNWSEIKTSQKRFVMTNNFTIPNKITNDYQVRLRTSYILGDSYKNFYCKNMYKDPNSANYVFFGTAIDNDNYPRILRIFGLEVNVGESNVWTDYYTGNNYLFGSAIATFHETEEETQVRFRCLCSSISTSSRHISCVEKTYTGNVELKNITGFSYIPYIDDNGYKKQSVFLDYDNVYFVQNNQHWGVSGTPDSKYIGLYKYDFNANETKTIYEKYLGEYDYSNLEAIYIDKCNTDIYIQYNTDIASGHATYYFQRLVDKWQPKYIGMGAFNYGNRSLFVKANFNLLQAYMYPLYQPANDYIIKEDYNSLNYNGTPYTDYNSMISRKGRVYSNNKIVFARNLYNKTIANNTTTSTIQIPNNYLNDINLETKKLLSQTNSEIDIDTNTITKNIYEMLYLNYIDTLNVIDEDTSTYYNDTAIYINNNINVGTEDNSKKSFVGKVRINYTTPQIQELNWEWKTNHYEASFMVDTHEEIPHTIDFISNDETTLYVSKNVQLQANKYYRIDQKLRIE